MQQEDRDGDSIEWQMKNGCEIDTRVCCILCCIFPIECLEDTLYPLKNQSAKHYLFFILWLELESKSMIWAATEQSNDRDMRGKETYLGYEVRFRALDFCSLHLIVHYFSNYLYSLCLKIVPLYYPTSDFILHNVPSLWSLFWNTLLPFENWHLPTIQGKVKMFPWHFLSREYQQLFLMCCRSTVLLLL